MRKKALAFPVTVNLSREQKEFLIRWAYTHGMSMSEAMRHALFCLEREPKENVARVQANR
jgi:hypothetical protein